MVIDIETDLETAADAEQVSSRFVSSDYDRMFVLSRKGDLKTCLVLQHLFISTLQSADEC